MPRILLVEDNEMNRDMLSRRLERKGHEVIVQKRRTDTDLRLFNCEPGIMMPGYLLERDKRKGVALSFFRVRAGGTVKLQNKIRREHFPRQSARSESNMPAQNFLAITASKTDRRNVTRQTIHI